MNILDVNNFTNSIQWRVNNNLEGEFFDCKLVETTTTYKVTSTDDTITYLIVPLNITAIKYSV
jgi:hypothetical protein